MATYRFTSELAEKFIARLLELLDEDRPERGLTRAEIEAALFASKTKVGSYIRHLRGDAETPRRIYICGYADSDEQGGRVPRYAAGNHRDAKAPGRKSNAERWAIVKATPEKHDRRKARLRADAARNRARQKPHGPFAALGV